MTASLRTCVLCLTLGIVAVLAGCDPVPALLIENEHDPEHPFHVPDPSSDLNLTSTGNPVRFEWTNHSTVADGIRIGRLSAYEHPNPSAWKLDLRPIGTLEPGATWFEDRADPLDESYQYRVYAFKGSRTSEGTAPLRIRIPWHRLAFRMDHFAISPQWDRLAVSVDDRLSLQSLPAGSTLATAYRIWSRPNAAIHHLAFSPIGDLLATAENGRTAAIFSTAYDEIRLLREIEADSSHVERVAFSPDGKLLATGGASDGIRIWNVDDGTSVIPALPQSLGPGRLQYWFVFLEFTADGRLLIAGNGHEITAFDAQTWSVRYTLPHNPPRTYPPGSVVLSPDGSMLALHGENVARVYDAADGRLVRSIHLDRDVSEVSIVPGNAEIAVCTYWGSTVYRIDTGEAVATHRHLSMIRYSRDGRYRLIRGPYDEHPTVVDTQAAWIVD